MRRPHVTTLAYSQNKKKGMELGKEEEPYYTHDSVTGREIMIRTRYGGT